jgi:Fe-S-cluster-containing dehydrogenase component
MKVNRREFLKCACLLVSAGALPFSRRLLGAGAKSAKAKYSFAGHKYAFIVDTRKCIGCGACVRACKLENKVPDGSFRTWVERYTVTKDSKVKVDSPDGALHGFEELKSVPGSEVVQAFFVPKLCNHCANAPCVPVCPVGATYKSPDGVVLTDPSYCFACGYCIQACPYGARFKNPVTRTADKCTWCYHRITKGLLPACVEICPTGARAFGDAAKPASPVARVLESERLGVLRKELDTRPKVYYVELDPKVR